MHTHKLTERDSWFIEKGQIDSYSRTPFDIGHVVVVCDNKHVLLSDVYNELRKCTTCSSSVTVPFSRSNIEHSKIEITNSQKKSLKIRTPKPSEMEKEFLQFFFPYNVARRVFPKVNFVLKWLIGLIVISFIILTAIGIVSFEQLLFHIEFVLIPTIEDLFLGFNDFWFPDDINSILIASNAEFFSRNVMVLGALRIGLENILMDFWVQVQLLRNETMILIEQFINRSRMVIEYFISE